MNPKQSKSAGKSSGRKPHAAGRNHSGAHSQTNSKSVQSSAARGRSAAPGSRSDSLRKPSAAAKTGSGSAGARASISGSRSGAARGSASIGRSRSGGAAAGNVPAGIGPFLEQLKTRVTTFFRTTDWKALSQNRAAQATAAGVLLIVLVLAITLGGRGGAASASASPTASASAVAVSGTAAAGETDASGTAASGFTATESVAAGASGEASTAATPAPTGIPLAEAVGTMTDGHYQNVHFGFSMDVPASWHVATNDEVNTLTANALKSLTDSAAANANLVGFAMNQVIPLMYAFKHPLDYKEGPNASLVVNGEYLGENADVEGTKYLDIFRARLETQADYNFTCSAIRSEKLGGADFSCVDITGEVKGIRMYQTLYWKMEDGYSLNFILTWFLDADKTELADTLKTVSFGQ